MNLRELHGRLSAVMIQRCARFLPLAYGLALAWAAGFMLQGAVTGPNFFSLRVVTVENARVWYLQRENGTNEIWTVEYIRQRLSDGVSVKGRIKLMWPDIPRQLRRSEPQDMIGTELLLRAKC